MLNVVIHAIMLILLDNTTKCFKSHVYIYVTYDGPMNTLNMGLTKLVYHTIIKRLTLLRKH